MHRLLSKTHLEAKQNKVHKYVSADFIETVICWRNKILIVCLCVCLSPAVCHAHREEEEEVEVWEVMMDDGIQTV